MKAEPLTSGVEGGVESLDSGIGSGSLDPHDSVSERGVNSVVESVSRDPTVVFALDGYSKFMLRALELVVSVDGCTAADVRSIAEGYASVVGGCVSAAVASSATLPVSVNGGSSGVSIRSGSTYSGSGVVRAGVMRSLSLPRVQPPPKVRSAGPSLLRSDVCGPGTCYLRFVATGCRTAARKCLGVWPTVRSLLRSPAALFDAALMDSCRFVQVSPDMYHVESSGSDSYQLAVSASLLRTLSCSSGDAGQFPDGSLGKLLSTKDSSRCAVPFMSLDARIGGSVRYASPSPGALWSEQREWCRLQGYCPEYWKEGVCSDASCDASHLRVSPARLRDVRYPCVSWSRSQKTKWCKHNGVCWKHAYFGKCHEGSLCEYSHVLPVGLVARFSLVGDRDTDVESSDSEAVALPSSVVPLPPVFGTTSDRLVFCSGLVTSLMSIRITMDGTNSQHSVPRHVVVENSRGEIVCIFGIDTDCGLDAASQISGSVSYWEARGLIRWLFRASAIDVSSSFGYESFFPSVRLHHEV